MAKKIELTEQEWSHFFDIEDIDHRQIKVDIEASQEELDDLSRRLTVIEIKAASASLTLEREQGGHVFHVFGTFKASLIQECVVTLEPIETKIKGPVEGWFADKEGAVSFAAAKRDREASRSHGEIEVVEEREDPEPVQDGRIDLGELVTQHISLEIPPYPHKKGAKFEFGDEDAQMNDKSPLRKNPFEALKDWKEKR